MTISPIVAAIIPAIVLVLRNLLPQLAESRVLTLVVVAALGALSAVAEQLGIPLGTEGQVVAGLLSALVGVGGVEAAKTIPAVRRINRSKEK